MKTSSIITFPVSQKYTCTLYLNHTLINENQSATLIEIMKGS